MDTIRVLEELVDKEVNLRFEPRHLADVRATWADIGKVARLLG